MSKKVPKPPPIIALGAMTFGGQTSERDAERMLEIFLEEGHTWVDTAFIYNEGRSEEILGRLLKGRRRQRVFLATKVYPDRLGPGKPRGLTPGSIRGQLEISLKRLQTDYVDLLYLHAPDNRTPLEATLQTCQKLIEEGKIREIGLSNYASWQVAEAALICEMNGWQPPMIYQGMYNALTRAVEEECLPACRHFGLDFIAYNPLAGGLLTGKYKDELAIPVTGRFADEYYRRRYWRTEYFEALRRIGQAIQGEGISMTEAALRWLVHHSQADGLLLGASKVDHLRENLLVCRGGPLPPAILRAFDAACDLTRGVCERYFRDERSPRPQLQVSSKR